MSPRVSARTDGGAPSTGTTIATVERAVDVLMHIATSPGPDFGITELADELSMSKAAVHRVLASLKGRGLIEVDERTRRYSLGVGALRLGLAYLDRIDVRRMGHPALERLSEKTNETATLSVLLGNHERIYVDQITPDREVIMSVSMGEPYPLHAGATGRAFLAFLEEGLREEYLAQGNLRAMTEQTVTDADEIRSIVTKIREQGWSFSAAERKSGAAAVAAPVLSHDGFPVAVISVCGPVERLAENVDVCREAVVETAGIMSRQFGWVG